MGALVLVASVAVALVADVPVAASEAEVASVAVALVVVLAVVDDKLLAVQRCRQPFRFDYLINAF